MTSDFRYRYGDYYGGLYRNQHCQKRIFKVSFRDLGWEVSESFSLRLHTLGRYGSSMMWCVWFIALIIIGPA